MATQFISTPIHFAPRGTARPSLHAGWSAVVAMLKARRSRRLLLEMDDRLLSDIGIDRGQAWMEATRAPWDLAERR